MDRKRILCFGDSLTWGWIAAKGGAPTTRFPFEQRWTGVMAAALGDGFEIVEEGLNARTTSIVDPFDPRLDGSAYLPSALASHLPLSLVILMLGTNDTKAAYRRTPFEIALGMQGLVGQVLGSAGGVGTSYPAPAVLVVAPPRLAEMPDPWFAAMFAGGHAKSAELAGLYAAMAAFMKVPFLDAGSVLTTDGIDGIHFSVDNNVSLGRALAAKVASLPL